MDPAPPRGGGRALATSIAIGLLAACSDSSSQRCEDGKYCPEGTRCGSGAFCLVEEAACADFGANAPCVGGGDGGARFCTPGGCRDGVTISGRLTSAGGGGPVGGARVSALDREWMAQVDTDEIGGFAIDAVQNDTELVLRLEGDDALPPVLTRRLALGAGDYQINGEATAALRVVTRASLLQFAKDKGLQPDPSRGAVAVQIGSQPGNGIGRATATLVGPTDQTALYFDQNGEAAPGASSTTATEPTAVFLELEPGVYTLTAAREGAIECLAAGDDRPDPIVVDVRAGELTAAGWIVCRQ